MLKRLKIFNFRSFLNFEVNLSPIHLIIGKNNSGKTNLARAIQFLGWTSYAPLNDAISQVPGSYFEFSHRSLRNEPTTFSCVCELIYEGAPTQFTYELVVKQTTDASGQNELVVLSEKLVADAAGFSNATLLENNGVESRMLHEKNFECAQVRYAGPTLSPRGATMLSKLYELTDNRRAIFLGGSLVNGLIFLSVQGKCGMAGRTLRIQQACTSSGTIWQTPSII